MKVKEEVRSHFPEALEVSSMPAFPTERVVTGRSSFHVQKGGPRSSLTRADLMFIARCSSF